MKQELSQNVLNRENHNLEDLTQKLINYLYKSEHYDQIDIEIMKILFKQND